MPMFLSQSVWCDCHHLSPYGILFYFIFIYFLFPRSLPGGARPLHHTRNPGGEVRFKWAFRTFSFCSVYQGK
jgi:hypothetical protein